MKATRLIATLLTISALSLSSTSAKTTVTVKLEGETIKGDVSAFIKNDTTVAPVRVISNALGAENIDWNEKNKTAIIKKGEKTIKIKIGEKIAEVDGVKKALQTSAIIVNNRTFVPIRFIAEAFGYNVSWDDKTYVANITKSDISSGDYTQTDLDWLAKIIHAEAQGESNSGKIGVGNVVLNRVKSRDFPNSIYEVIFDRKYGVQFTPVANGAIYNVPAPQSYSAARSALDGVNVVGESLYFCNPAISTNTWIQNNRPFFTTIGKHNFYL